MSNGPTKTLFFLPDISGFTRFVNETEINHSTHIISELLEIIIKENKTGLEIAEIEGDAVFFYKLDPDLSIEDIVSQCESMFVAFHSHLKRYEEDRICQCGACTTASKLSLKFIAHAGESIVQTISDRTKLMGKDVTYAHKLMKNDISSNEYILLSSNITDNDDKLPTHNWFSLSKATATYDGVGEVNYQYSVLKDLLAEVPEASERDKSHFVLEQPPTITTIINKPMLFVHAKLIDMNIRPQWRTKIGRVTDKVERIGTIHDCIIPTGNLDIAVLDNEVQDNKIVYKEQSAGNKGLFGPKLTEVFVIKELDEHSCELTSELHINTSQLHKFLILPLLKTGIAKSHKKFKALCEQ